MSHLTPSLVPSLSAPVFTSLAVRRKNWSGATGNEAISPRVQLSSTVKSTSFKPLQLTVTNQYLIKMQHSLACLKTLNSCQQKKSPRTFFAEPPNQPTSWVHVMPFCKCGLPHSTIQELIRWTAGKPLYTSITRLSQKTIVCRI